MENVIKTHLTADKEPLAAESFTCTGYDSKPEFEAIKRDLQQKLKPSRYEHTLGVADTAAKLAAQYGQNPEKAYLTGLLHDCAKYLSDDEMISAALDLNLTLEPVEYRAVQLIHAKVGAEYARIRYKVEDEDILNAIRYHTTGHPGMTALEKIIYIADTIEPSRSFNSELLEKLRKLAFEDLDLALFEILDSTMKHLKEAFSGNISNLTLQTYEYYKDKIAKNTDKQNSNGSK